MLAGMQFHLSSIIAVMEWKFFCSHLTIFIKAFSGLRSPRPAPYMSATHHFGPLTVFAFAVGNAMISAFATMVVEFS